MDLVIDLFEDFAVAPLLRAISVDDFPAGSESLLARESILRQATVAWLVYTLGGLFSYFFFSYLSYHFLHIPALTADKLNSVVHTDKGKLGSKICGFLRSLKHHPYETQVWDEINMSLKAIPVMAILTVPFVLMEYRGLTLLYGPKTEYSFRDYGLSWCLLSVVLFLLFTDAAIYFIHVALHSKYLYKRLHKSHHLWKSPTPFAAFAFHPVDGWAQSIPYHVFTFLVPMHKIVHLMLFILVNIWTVSIHDGISGEPPKWLNGAAHHTYHHSDFNYNYGQYFTFWDWIMGTLRDPYASGRLLDESLTQGKEAKGSEKSTKKKADVRRRSSSKPREAKKSKPSSKSVRERKTAAKEKMK